MPTDPDVAAYIEGSQRWPDEMAALRPILLGAGLSEALKWGKPCFTHAGRNIAIFQEMNGFLSLMFFKGALLRDPGGVLVEQGPNSKSARRIELTSVDEVTRLADTIESLALEAIAAEEAGLEVVAAPEPVLVEELRRRLDEDPALRAAFESLTPGRQREYNIYISAAKQVKTREARIDKHTARILAGKGMRD